MARDRSATVSRSVKSLHGLVLAPAKARLLGDFLVSPADNLSGMSAPAMIPTTKVVFALLRITLADLIIWK